jgi:aminoglycoside phosphotransferase (APT) family kinase protein
LSARRPDARLRRAARAIFEASTGTPARRIRAQSGGATNQVFSIEAAEGFFVLRMDPSPAKVDEYRKERWAIEHARRMDIPAPNVIAVGVTPDDVAFMLARLEPGRVAAELVQTEPVLRQLGQYARKLHETSLSLFGGHHEGLTAPWETWPEFLEHEFGLARRLEQLQSLGLFDERVARRAAELVLRLGDDHEPRLNHGDLRLKNVLVTEDGRINAIIDWEGAVAAPAPEWDLALALHDLSVDEKDAFIDGYGLSDEALRVATPALAALNMLHYAPFAAAAAEAGDEEQLRRYRRRFARVYELYSL